jgi:hypothetical protein
MRRVPMLSPRMKKMALAVVIGGIVAGGAIQLVPVKNIGSNPPERFKVDAPPDVEAVLRRSCFDCHSNETRWPLYSRLAPGSWLMSRDVTKGRQHMNFSEWGSADEEERHTDMENAAEQIASGDMPPWFYLYPMHLSSRLSEADKGLLRGWLLKHKQQDKKAEAAGRAPAEAAPPTAAH